MDTTNYNTLQNSHPYSSYFKSLMTCYKLLFGRSQYAYCYTNVHLSFHLAITRWICAETKQRSKIVTTLPESLFLHFGRA